MNATTRTLLCCCLAAGGCVQYTPIALGSIPPNQEVRVEVTDDGAIRLARHLGRLTHEVTAFVEPGTADSIAVTIWLGRDYQGTDFANVRETVVLPRAEVKSLTLRELNKGRTTILSAMALGGSIVLANKIFQQGDPNRPPGDDNEPPPSVTLFRVLLGLIPRGAK